MSDRVKHLADEAAKLTPEEQAELMDALAALTPRDAEWERAWADEADRRLAAYDRGEMKAYTWDEVKAQLRKL